MRINKKKCAMVLLVMLTIGIVLTTQVAAFNVSSSSNSQSASPVYGAEISFNSEKLQEAAEKYANAEPLTGNALIAHNKKVDDIFLNDQISDEERESILNELGVYTIDDGIEVKYASSSGNVTCNKPTIAYDSVNYLYKITATGSWSASSYWAADCNATIDWDLAPYVGKIVNIGGAEGIGISITNTSGSTTGLAVTAGYGYLTSGTSRLSSTLVTNDDRYGAGYEPQDVVKYLTINYVLGVPVSGTFNYNAATFKTQVAYNTKLANYSGSAKLFYLHNWESTKITSLGVSSSGASAGWESGDKHWGPAYSYARTFANGVQTN